MSGIWYVATKRDRTVEVQPPPSPPAPVDYTWFNDFLEKYHTPPSYTPDPNVGGNPTSHAEQMAQYRLVYENETYVPWRDGLVYYDPAAVAMGAFYYKQAAGLGQDSRWTDFADDAGTFWHLANVRDAYGTGTGVYHFPQGLWLCQDAGIALTPAEFEADCDNAIRKFYGSIYYSGSSTHEREVRTSGRLMEWLSFYYRMVGHDDPTYKDNDSHRGQRYHTGQFYQERHIWEWLDEWTFSPQYGYPRWGGGNFTDPLDYMALSIDPGNSLGLAIFYFGPFMSNFAYQANMHLWNEDANYQTSQRVEYVKRLVDFNRANGWFVPNGTPGSISEFGAWGYYYCLCGPDDGVRVPHAYCGGSNGYWGHRLYASRELTGFHLEACAWLWRVTGDDTYLGYFDDTWNALKGMYENGDFDAFFRSYQFGKQCNQIAMRAFNAITLRGDYQFKTAMYPQGTFPYPTPPKVSPS